MKTIFAILVLATLSLPTWAIVGKVVGNQGKPTASAAVDDYSAVTGNADQALQHIAGLAEKEPYRYVETLSKMIQYVAKKGDLDTGEKLLAGFKDHPGCEQANTSRLALARALRAHSRSAEAANILREGLKQDAFGQEATTTMELFADMLEKDLKQNQEAYEVRRNLAQNYYSGDPIVAQTRAALGGAAPAPPRNNCILLDESMGESSIYDRELDGSCNFGQYEVLLALVEAGFKTHSTGNVRTSPFSRDILDKYGLVVMNGRYGGADNPPIPNDAVDALVSYVRGGGSLLIVAAGNGFGKGKQAQFYNKLIGKFGLRFTEGVSLPYNDRGGRLTNHPVVSGVRQLSAPGGVPVESDGKQVLAYYDGKPVIALANYGEGRVIAAGMGSGFMGQCMGNDQDQYGRQNKALLVRLASYLLDPTSAPGIAQQSSAPKTVAAADLPFLSSPLPAGIADEAQAKADKAAQLEQDGKNAEAIQAWQDLLKQYAQTEPDNVQLTTVKASAAIGIAEALRQSDQLDAALAAFNQFLTDYPQRRSFCADAYVAIGKIYQKKGEYVKSIDAFAKVLSDYPERITRADFAASRISEVKKNVTDMPSDLQARLTNAFAVYDKAKQENNAIKDIANGAVAKAQKQDRTGGAADLLPLFSNPAVLKSQAQLRMLGDTQSTWCWDRDNARVTYNKFLEVAKTELDPKAYRLARVDLFYKLGDNASVVAEALELRRAYPGEDFGIDQDYLLANAYDYNNQFDEAVAAYMSIVSRYGSSSNPNERESVTCSLMRSGILLEQQDKKAEAIQAYDLATKYQDAPQTKICVDYLNRLCETTPADTAQARFDKANALEKQGKHADAIKVWRGLLTEYAKAPSSPQLTIVKSETLLAIAETQRQTDQLDDAVVTFNQVLSGYPKLHSNCADATIGIAKVYQKKGENLKAIQEYAKVLTDYPERISRADFARTRISEVQKNTPNLSAAVQAQLKKAYAVYDNAKREDEELRTASRLADAKCDKKDFATAKAIHLKMFANPMVQASQGRLTLLGDCQWIQGNDPENAKVTYKRYLEVARDELDPRSYRVARVVTHYKLNEYAPLITEAAQTRALYKDGDFGIRFYYAVAQAYDFTGQGDKAIEAYGEVASRYASGSDAESRDLSAAALVRSGYILERAGKKQEAIAKYERVTKDFSDTKFAAALKDKLAQLKKEVGGGTSAEEMH